MSGICEKCRSTIADRKEFTGNVTDGSFEVIVSPKLRFSAKEISAYTGTYCKQANIQIMITYGWMSE